MAGKYSPYSEYKDSCNILLGDVPKHWQLTRVKYVAELTPKKPIVDRSLDCSFIPMEKLKTDSIILDETKQIDAVYDGYTYFADGDILMAKVTPCFENKNIAIASGLTNKIGFGSSEIYTIRTSKKVDNRFLFYRLQEDGFMDLSIGAMTGAGGLKRVPSEIVENYAYASPEDEEQEKIANFLDHETAKIDTLIDKQQQLIKLLKEKRQAMISHAVTKGINPNAPIRDSGVEWLGEVPEHWDVKLIKHVCQLQSGHTPSKSNPSFWIEEECVIPWVSLNDTKNIDGSDFLNDSATKISEIGMDNSSAHYIEKGAIVFTRDGARIGLAAIMGKPMCVSQHIIAWVCGEGINNHFLLHVIYAMNDELYRISAGATIPTIGMTDIKKMTMCVPPLDEQLQIVGHLLQKR